MKNFCKRVPAAMKGDEDFLKLTSKQLLVFYWLISKSYWEEGAGKDFYFLYRDTINYSQMGKDLGIKSNNTISNAFEKLKQNGKIEMTENLIRIPFPKSSASLHIDLIRFLLAESIKVGGDLLLCYSILKRKWEKYRRWDYPLIFKDRDMVKALGFKTSSNEIYERMRGYLKLFRSWNLIEVVIREEHYKGDVFMEYSIRKVEGKLPKELEVEE